MNIRAVLIVGGLLFVSNEALAIQWCKLEIRNANGTLTLIEKADRTQKFFDKNVDKLDDCDTCWSQGKKNGPGACEATSKEYIITCLKNGGQQKSKTYPCP